MHRGLPGGDPPRAATTSTTGWIRSTGHPTHEMGIPDTYGFTFLGTVEGLDNTAYIDEDLLSFGATYCYRVVTAWPGSGESIASNEVCRRSGRTLPVITRASVEATDEANGSVELRWSPPTDADTVVSQAIPVSGVGRC